MTLAEAKKRPEPDPIPTDGTITIGEAARQNNIPHSTVSRWIKRGLITVKHYTRNGRYVEPADVKAVADKYKTDPGRGKRTALQAA